MNSKINFLYLLTVLLCATTNVLSQEKSFEYILATNNDELAYGIYEDTIEHVYYITGRTQPTGINHKKALFIKLSNEGVLLDSALLVDSLQSYFMFDILDGFSDTLLFSGLKYDTGYPIQSRINPSLIFYLCNKNLEPIDTIQFPLPANHAYFLSYIRRLSNGKYIELGALVDTIGNPTPMFYLYEFSPKLDSLQFVFWPDSLGHGSDIKLQKDGNYWALINGFPGWKPHYWVLDTNYNVLAKDKVPEYLSDPFGLKWDSDSTFYVIGQGGGDNDNDIGIMRQLQTDYNDPDKNIFSSWGTDSIDYPAIKGGLDFNNKDSIFIGGMALWWGDFWEVSNWFVVLQTDSLLNLRWERFYGGDAYYTMWKLIATSDGGCIAAGSRYDYKNTNERQEDIYVLKLNKEGLIVGNSTPPQIQMQEAIVYPNPGTNYIKVRIAEQYPNSTFELYDMAGNHVLTKSIVGKWGEIETSFLQSGTFVYRIFNDDGLSETGKWVKQ